MQTPEDPRVRFAGERTQLAWVRTGLAMMGFGFVVARFGLFLREISNAEHPISDQSFRFSLWLGAGLIILGIVVHFLTASQHVQFLRRLNAGEPYQPPRWSLAVIVAVTLAIIGIAMVIYIVVLARPIVIS